MVDHDALMKTARTALRAASTIAGATAEVRRAHPDAPEWLVDQSIGILLGGDLVDPNPPTPGSLRAKFWREISDEGCGDPEQANSRRRPTTSPTVTKRKRPDR